MKIVINVILAYYTLFFIISVGIGTYFIYYKYMNHNKRNVSKYYIIFIIHKIKWE